MLYPLVGGDGASRKKWSSKRPVCEMCDEKQSNCESDSDSDSALESRKTEPQTQATSISSVHSAACCALLCLVRPPASSAVGPTRSSHWLLLGPPKPDLGLEDEGHNRLEYCRPGFLEASAIIADMALALPPACSAQNDKMRLSSLLALGAAHCCYCRCRFIWPIHYHVAHPSRTIRWHSSESHTHTHSLTPMCLQRGLLPVSRVGVILHRAAEWNAHSIRPPASRFPLSSFLGSLSTHPVAEVTHDDDQACKAAISQANPPS